MSTDDISMNTEIFPFPADIIQLVSTINEIFQSSKAISIRELLTNALVAVSKVKFVRYNSLYTLETGLSIKIILNASEKTLTIIDNGIGMTKSDLINKLGTHEKPRDIKSYAQFWKSCIESNSAISFLGVGFYSVYLVADKVTVVSKNDNDKQYLWESDGRDSFTVRSDHGEPLKRGTKIVLHIKEDDTEFLQERKIKAIVQNYTRLFPYPVHFIVVNTYSHKVNDDDADNGDKTDDDKDMKYKENTEKKKKITHGTYVVEQVLNAKKHFWCYDPINISQGDYEEFYQLFANDSETYLAVKHFFVNSDLNFQALLFTPKYKSVDNFGKEKKENNIRLYAYHAFVAEYCEELLPEYLWFIKGVVDSQDLDSIFPPGSPAYTDILKATRKILVKKSLEMLEELAENKEKYKKFYREFGVHLKCGALEDSDNREKLFDLLRFYTSASGDEACSLKDYVSRMKKNQTQIYYITGENRHKLASSVLIERITKFGYEVIYSDPLDKFVLANMSEYDGKNLASANTEGLVLPETDKDKEKREKDQCRYQKLCKVIKEMLDGRVEKVLISNRLVESPACIVTSQNGGPTNIMRILGAQRLKDLFSDNDVSSKKILEINPDHRIIKTLIKKAEDSPNDMTVQDLVKLLFDTSLMTSGFRPESPLFIATKLQSMIQLSLRIEEDLSDTETDFANVESNLVGEGSAENAYDMEKLD